jgi:hypothetical protein
VSSQCDVLSKHTSWRGTPTGDRDMVHPFQLRISLTDALSEASSTRLRASVDPAEVRKTESQFAVAVDDRGASQMDFQA